ncbi:MAG: ferritin family protein [Candidatus Glassbacteria bacterium]
MTGNRELPDDLSPMEIYAIAIRSEIEARDIYHRAADQIENESLKDKLDFLGREEEKHRKILEGLYCERFPDVELLLPDNTFLPKIDIALSEDSTIEELFEVAIEWERRSGDFYEAISGKASDPSTKAVLISLGAAEWGHYHLLKSEYDLIKAFPSYTSTKDFSPGEDSIHIGP